MLRIKNISIAKNIPFDVACTKDIPVEVQFIRNKFLEFVTKTSGSPE